MKCLIASIVVTLDDKVMGGVQNVACIIENVLKNKKQFKIYSNALYATEIKFHHTNRPQDSQIESKLYFSSVHHLYGYKIEISVSYVGFCCTI